MDLSLIVLVILLALFIFKTRGDQREPFVGVIPVGGVREDPVTRPLLESRFHRANTMRQVVPVTTHSHYAQDKPGLKDIAISDQELINQVYDRLVDDQRKETTRFQVLDTVDRSEYFEIDKANQYGYTEFMTYNKA
jgi:hypothetical protein